MAAVPQVPRFDPLAMAPHAETGLQRGQRGRPKLIPRGLNTRVEYTRASALSGYIMGGSQHGLEKWTRRLIIRGAGMKPHVARMAAAEDYDQAPGTIKDEQYREAGQNLDRYVEEAIEAAGGHDKANWGTAVHSMLRPNSQGKLAEEDVEGARSVEGAKAAMRAFRRLGSELFVANDELLAAGTFDGALDMPDFAGEAVCADWKTGELHIVEHVVQMAVYVGGELYDVETDERTSFADGLGVPMRTDVGLVVRIPTALSNHPVPEKRAKLYLVDLTEGLRLARVAVYIRQMQKTQSLGLLDTLDPREQAQKRAKLDMIALGPDIDAVGLRAVFEQWREDWCDELTQFGKGLLETTRESA